MNECHFKKPVKGVVVVVRPAAVVKTPRNSGSHTAERASLGRGCDILSLFAPKSLILEDKRQKDTPYGHILEKMGTKDVPRLPTVTNMPHSLPSP